MKSVRSGIAPAFLAGLALLAWQLVVEAFGIAPYLLPAPTAVAAALAKNLPMLASDAFLTAFEAGAGLALAFLVSIFLALAFVGVPLFERSFMPLVLAFQAVPIVAIAPLLVLWFGNGVAGKVVLSALMCFFPALINISRGLRAAAPPAMLLMNSLSASPLQILLKLRIPSAVPHFFAALRITASLSVIGAIVAEISGATRGIGFRIVISSYRTDTQMLFASLFFAVLLGWLFYGISAWAERMVHAWRPFSRVA